MRIIISLSFFILSSGFALADEIQWVRSYEQGMKLARESRRPVMVDFWAVWCGPCREMDREVYNDRKVIEASKRFVFIQVDVDKDSATSARFAARVIPTMVFLDPWQSLLMRREGFARASELLEMMKPIPPDFSTVAAHFELLERDDQNFNALMGIGSFYKSSGFIAVARNFYNQALKTSRAREDTDARDKGVIALGLLALAANDLKEAERIFQKGCTNCAPQNQPFMLLGLAKTYLQMKRPKQARELWQTIITQFPNSEYAPVAKENLEKVK